MLLQIGLPVEADRTIDVALVVRVGVDVHLERSDVGVLGVFGQPIGLDEHFVGIFRHVVPLSSS